MLNQHCSVRSEFVQLLHLITSALVCSEISPHIVCATKEDGQLLRLSFLKLKKAMWENNLFPFLLDMKETYFDIALLMLFLFFLYVEILLILSLYLLLMLCVHLSLQCVCVQCVCVFVNLLAYACI